MTRKSLWDMFTTPYILVFQADTLVCRQLDIPRFEAAHYDYLGSPSLHYNNNQITRVPWENMEKPFRVFLNGGIALHRRQWTLACTRRFQRVLLNEDAKWNECGFKLPTAFDAMSFGSDNGFTMCFTHDGRRICPSVVHKPWVRYNTINELRELEESCPRLREMRSAWQH